MGLSLFLSVFDFAQRLWREVTEVCATHPSFTMGHVLEPKGCGPQNVESGGHVRRQRLPFRCLPSWLATQRERLRCSRRSYVGCHSVQRFDMFGPSDKRTWESACGAHFLLCFLICDSGV